MKYMTDGSFQQSSLMKLTLGLALVFLVLFWVTNFAMYFSKMDLRSASVASYYLGSEEDFRPARSAASMLETAHMHLPMMALVLLFLTHLTIFIPAPRAAKVWLTIATFLSAALDEGGGWLVRFASPSFAIVKIVGFVGLQACIFLLLVLLGVFLMRRTRPSMLDGI